MKDKLARFLETGQAWARTTTSVPGVFILKMPPWKGRGAVLAVELNPVNGVGSPTKKRGLILKTEEELKTFAGLIGHESLPKVLGTLDEINPAAGSVVPEAAIQI